MPRLAKVQLERRARNVEPQQAEEVSAEQGEQGGEEELAPGDEGERRHAEVEDVDVLEAGDEEEGAGVSGILVKVRCVLCQVAIR